MIILDSLACEAINKLTNGEGLFWLVTLGFLAVGFVGMSLCRRWPLMAVLIIPVIALAGAKQMIELNQFYAGTTASPGVLLRTVVLSYFAIIGCFVLVVVGTIEGSRRRKLGASSRLIR